MTEQEKIWKSNFGADYNVRNYYSNRDLDEVYVSDIGISRTEMNKNFIGHLDRNIKILEIGCNVGIQLVNLQELGFKNLYGIEIQPHAIELSKKFLVGINIIEASVYDIPFKDEFFDLVYTNRVLIHINPNFISKALCEIHRCSNNLIYGSEYYSDELTEIYYRNLNNIAWKRNFAKLYLESFNDLELLKEKKYKYTFNNDVDSTFLLKKQKDIEK